MFDSDLNQHWEDRNDDQLKMALVDLLRKDEQGSDPQLLRGGLGLLAQELIEAEVPEAIGAAPYEQTVKRTTSRDGVRDRTVAKWSAFPPSEPTQEEVVQALLELQTA